MNKKKGGAFLKTLEKIGDKGFYIILSLCIVAIGVSGYVLFFTDNSGDIITDIEAGNPEDPQDGQISVPDDPFVDAPIPPDTKLPVSTQDDDPLTGTDEPTQPTVQQPRAILPSGGQVIRGYSGDTLLYDVTMCDWRTHNGTDFACTKGDTVFCIKDGTVSRVYEDGLMGWTVKVEHANGLQSSYSGLSPVLSVSEGQAVKMGEAVGTAGGTAIAESSQPYHIHVSVTDDGKFIDVMSFFE